VGMKVLVVDDDPTSLLVLKRMLDECRYDGKQAITRLPLVQGNSEMPYC
jgi:CheY-like chemotaxis protein